MTKILRLLALLLISYGIARSQCGKLSINPLTGQLDCSGTGGGGGTGTVTSVGMTVPSFLSVSGSPITTSGSFAVTLATQTANTVFAGPTSGGAATPTFRALVAADIPSGVAAGGDLSGTYPNPTVAKIQGSAVKSSLACSDTFVLTWVTANSRFECLAASGGGGTPGGSDTQYQYNNAGAFGGSDQFTRDGTNRRNVMTRADIEFDPLASPGAPGVALVAAAGNIDPGDYQYVSIWCEDAGCSRHTALGTASSVITTDGGNGQVTVSRPSSPPASATHWAVYRTYNAQAGAYYFVPTSITVVGTTSFIDDTNDSDLTLGVPQVSTTAGSVYSNSTRAYISGRLSKLRFGPNAADFDSDIFNLSPYNVGLSTPFAIYSSTTGLNSDTPTGSPNEDLAVLWLDKTANGTTGTVSSDALRISATIRGAGGSVYGSTYLWSGDNQWLSAGTGTTIGGLFITTTSGAGTGNLSGRVYGENITAASGNNVAQGTIAIFTDLYRFGGTSDATGIQVDRSTIVSGTTTNSYGVRMTTPTTSGVTNNYGLKVEDHTGATNNWAIKTGLGKNQFGDVVQIDGVAFASLPSTPANGMRIYCTDCTVTSGSDNTCAASGTGANAYRDNGAWKCFQ